MNLLARVLIGVLVLGLIVAGAFMLFERRIGKAVFNRAVADVGVDRSTALPDGLHVYLCGTGGPMPDPARAGPCLAVLAGERGFVFDAGSGSMRVLARMGFPLQRLERVYLTHLHSDHIDGLGELMLQAWVGGGRDTPLPIAGPVGVSEVVEGFNRAYRIDSRFRTAHHGVGVANPAGFGGVAEEIAAPAPSGQIVFEDDDLSIMAVPVTHAPVDHAFGFVVRYRDRAVAISGDTTYNDSFIAAASGVDVLIHEALNQEMVAQLGARARANGQSALAKIAADIPDYHTTPADAARAAQAAGARELILYHIVPPAPGRVLYAAYVGDAPQAFDGRIRMGEDGALVSLPAGSDAIRVSNALR